MTFEKTEASLTALIDRALQDDSELRKDLDETRYEGHDIYDELALQQESIWEVVVDEIRTYESTNNDLEERRKRLAGEVSAPPTEASLKASTPVALLNNLGAFYTFGLIVWGVVAVWRGWRPTLSALSSTDFWLPLALRILPSVVWVLGAQWLERRRERDVARRVAEHTKNLAEWTKKRDEVAAQFGIPTAEERLRAHEQKIDQLLFERTKQAIVAAINRRKDPSYANTLAIRKPRGFGEIFDKRFTIVTPARKRLEFMLKSMPGGSIGIAGSRGAGKTTLLKMFCGPKRIIDKLNDKPVLGVLVSAPVAYDARDFILYLFSTVCQNVIDAEGGSYKFPGAPADEPPGELLDAPVFKAFRRLPRFLVQAGLCLTLVGGLLAILLAAPPSPPASATASTAAAPDAASRRPDAASAATATPIPSGTTNPAAVTQAPAQPAQTSGDGFGMRLMKQLKIEPGVWVGWGVLMIVVGLILAEVVALGARWIAVRSIAVPLQAMLGFIPPLAERIDDFLRSEREIAITRRTHPPPPDTKPRPPDDSMWAHAETWLRAIKFQQSFTSGWSGSLKLPVGIEGGVNRAVTLAQNQLSLPEIVDFLARFLEEVSLKYQVIIGIDEMDKLSSDTLAQQFLNDIKSVFGLERCFYLISVSENAMSSFERRGLPFRDVFDSSFDDFVYVDHLTFESAQELLQQRVVGRPIPFFGLSYCMSGGLARDLIRNFRGVLEIHEQDPSQDSLTSICKRMVETDLQAKLRAIATSARKIKLEQRVDTFVEALFEIEAHIDDDDRLVESALAFFATDAAATIQTAQTDTVPPSQPDAARSNDDRDRAAAIEEMRDLEEEIATYILYAVTVRRFFNDKLTKSMLTTSRRSGKLDTLAKARQLLGVNPRITRALLRAFAAAHHLDALPAETVVGIATRSARRDNRRKARHHPVA
jgi:hypothetical protein